MFDSDPISLFTISLKYCYIPILFYCYIPLPSFYIMVTWNDHDMKKEIKNVE